MEGEHLRTRKKRESGEDGVGEEERHRSAKGFWANGGRKERGRGARRLTACEVSVSVHAATHHPLTHPFTRGSRDARRDARFEESSRGCQRGVCTRVYEHLV